MDKYLWYKHEKNPILPHSDFKEQGKPKHQEMQYDVASGPIQAMFWGTRCKVILYLGEELDQMHVRLCHNLV
jgi:hypothetical protein